MTPASAARVTRVLTGGFTGYVFLATLAHVIIYYLPRSISPLAPEHYGTLIDSMLVHGGALFLAGCGWGLARKARRVPPRVPRVLACVFILGGVALADTFVGVFFPPRERSDNVFDLHLARGWTNRPNNRLPLGRTPMYFDENGLRIDSDGQRVDETGAVRILFVGDSVTLGYYHHARDAYGRQTVEILKQCHPDAKLVDLNGGTCGYDTRQECHWLNEIGLKLEPDLIVLQFCLNDVTGQFDPAFGQNPFRHGEFRSITCRSSRSGIRRAITELVKRWKFGSDLDAAAENIEQFAIRDLLEAVPAERVEQSWRIVIPELKRFAELCRSADVPLVLVCFPVREQMERPDVSRNPQERLAHFAAAESVPYLDLLPIFRAAFGTGAKAMNTSFVDPTHPTIEGHRVAGEATASFLEKTGVLSEVIAAAANLD